jgi:hypothetical protein
MKRKKSIRIEQKEKISVAGGTIFIGVESVPSSSASVSKTNIAELIKVARRVSSLGTYTVDNGY